MEDASLDRFANAADADEEADEGVADDAAAADARDASAPGAADVDLAMSTATWTPGGAACEACGESAERRWRTDEGIVCVDCVDW
ncbi:hypothetical protein ACKVMT_08460 [Halobacteriales archaeon Cl-PHB]